MASNIYDVLDPPKAAPERNIYEEMEAKLTPFDKALVAREDEILTYQARRQEDYMKRQEALRKLDAQNPESRVGSDVMREDAPMWEPYIDFREPPLAPREDRPAFPEKPPLSGAGINMGLEPQLTPPEPPKPNALGPGYPASFKMNLVRDPETRKRILAQTLFPDDPEGIYRVGFDAHGDPVYVGEDGKLHQVATGTERFAASLAANAPEDIANLGYLAGPLAGTTFTAGTHGVKRLIAGAIFDEPQDPVQNAVDMAMEAGTSLAGERAGRALIGIRNAGRMGIDFPAAELARADALRRQVLQDTGVNLNLADASDDPFIKALYQYGWRQSGEASRALRDARGLNNLEFQTETDRVLNSIAPDEPFEVSGRRAMDASRTALRNASARAQRIADPFYHRAWAAHPVVRDPTVLSFFNLPGFPEAYDAAVVLARQERVPLQQYRHPSLQMMDYWLRELKGRARSLRAADPHSQMAGAMEQRIDELDTALLDAYPELDMARRTYRTARMALVEPLENGKVGVLANIENPKAADAAARIFTGRVSPQEITTARRAIESADPRAWAGVTRQWLAEKWDESLRRTQSGEIRNPPGKMQQSVFGTPHEEEIARAMLTPQQYRSFENLMSAAQRLASTPVGGSTTPLDQSFEKALEGNIGWVAQLGQAVRHPAKSAEDMVRKAAREQNLLDVMQALLDPAQRHRLDVITRMRPGKQQATLLGALISEETTKRFIQSNMGMGENSKLVAGEEDAIGE